MVTHTQKFGLANVCHTLYQITKPQHHPCHHKVLADRLPPRNSINRKKHLSATHCTCTVRRSSPVGSGIVRWLDRTTLYSFHKNTCAHNCHRIAPMDTLHSAIVNTDNPVSALLTITAVPALAGESTGHRAIQLVSYRGLHRQQEYERPISVYLT